MTAPQATSSTGEPILRHTYHIELIVTALADVHPEDIRADLVHLIGNIREGGLPTFWLPRLGRRRRSNALAWWAHRIADPVVQLVPAPAPCGHAEHTYEVVVLARDGITDTERRLTDATEAADALITIGSNLPEGDQAHLVAYGPDGSPCYGRVLTGIAALTEALAQLPPEGSTSPTEPTQDGAA